MTISKIHNSKFFINIPKVTPFNGNINGLTTAAPTRKVAATTNSFTFKNLFSTNYNQGELSPRVDSDLAKSAVGNVLPRLYA